MAYDGSSGRRGERIRDSLPRIAVSAGDALNGDPRDAWLPLTQTRFVGFSDGTSNAYALVDVSIREAGNPATQVSGTEIEPPNHI